MRLRGVLGGEGGGGGAGEGVPGRRERRSGGGGSGEGGADDGGGRAPAPLQPAPGKCFPHEIRAERGVGGRLLGLST